MSDWLSCLGTAVWATNTATANGWAGLVIGAAIGIALSFHPVFRFPDKPYFDNSVGKLVVVICTFTGLLAGELLRAAWARVC
jgi:hypothetical protein